VHTWGWPAVETIRIVNVRTGENFIRKLLLDPVDDFTKRKYAGQTENHQTDDDGANLALADHYSVAWDKEDYLYSLWNVPIDEQGRLLGKEALAPNRWHDLTIEWNVTSRVAKVSLNKKRIASLPLRRETTGANYLRIRSTAVGADPAGLLVESAVVNIRRE
jgi:hypothetical protein